MVQRVPRTPPVHASWLNQIEIYFSIVQRKVLTPNDFKSLNELEHRLLAFERRYEETASFNGPSLAKIWLLSWRKSKTSSSLPRPDALPIRHRNSEQEHLACASQRAQQ